MDSNYECCNNKLCYILYYDFWEKTLLGLLLLFIVVAIIFTALPTMAGLLCNRHITFSGYLYGIIIILLTPFMTIYSTISMLSDKWKE